MRYDLERFWPVLGGNVKRLRADRGYSKRRMVEEFQVHLDQLSKLEAGEQVSTRTVLQCCNAFALTLDELLGAGA